MKNKKVLKQIVKMVKTLTLLKPVISLVKWNYWVWNIYPEIGLWVIGGEISLLLTFAIWYVDKVYLSSRKR